MRRSTLLPALLVAMFGSPVWAESMVETVTLTASVWGWLSIGVFAIGYLFVVLEEKTHLKKSIPMMIVAGVIWTLIAVGYRLAGDMETAGAGLEHAIMEYGMLLLFLLAAMAYVNTLQERNVFEVIRYKLLAAGLSQRALFWATGTAAFFLSPVLDNLTTALVMCSVAVAVGAGNPRFVGLSAINIVIAANAGGAYSPFGDITTLMVWQAGKAEFFEFFSIFLPSLVNWLVPAIAVSFAVRSSNVRVANEPVALKRGAVSIMLLFALTIVFAVLAHQLFHIPSAMGMMLGLGLLKLYGYFLTQYEQRTFPDASIPPGLDSEMLLSEWKPRHKPFDTFVSVKRAEWDTLLFFFGVLMAVAGLAQIGYLAQVSQWSYGGLGDTETNILIGFLSAVVDNIPVMYAVLQMSPEMSHGQWLLVTLTAGTGGSLLSVGSAAGVALMGFAKVSDQHGNKVDAYTFFGHLKWTPVILLGYLASIQVHIWLHPDVTPLW